MSFSLQTTTFSISRSEFRLFREKKLESNARLARFVVMYIRSMGVILHSAFVSAPPHFIP